MTVKSEKDLDSLIAKIVEQFGLQAEAACNKFVREVYPDLKCHVRLHVKVTPFIEIDGGRRGEVS